MKLAKIAMGAIALASATPAFADVTVEITGATAFRVAALDTIKARYVASGAPFKFAHDKGAGGFNGSNQAVFIGTFPGVTGTTTIRTSFNGSVEGIRAIVQGGVHNPNFLEASTLSSTTAIVGGAEKPATTSPVSPSQAEFSFSDVNVASTPFAGAPLEPSDAAAGVVVFTMIANEGAPAGLTNVSAKQFQALYSSGYLPLGMFTGNALDTDLVLATGRNDGSGTRTTYMAETGLGITTGVQQYVRGTFSGNTITQIHRVPQGGFSSSIPGSLASNASTVWGNDVPGNGGYSSGSALRDDMGRTSASVELLDVDGSILDSGINVHLITFLSLGDAAPARTAGAKILGYNGVILSDFAATGTLSAADKAKVTEGSYTAWGFQQFYRRPSLSTDTVTVYNGIKNNIGANLGVTGIPISDMHVGRSVDGGPVAP